jgi:hypothetical protein
VRIAFHGITKAWNIFKVRNVTAGKKRFRNYMLVGSGAKTSVDIIQFLGANDAVLLRALFDKQEPKAAPNKSHDA